MKKNNKAMFVMVIIFSIVVALMFIFLGFVLLGRIFGDDNLVPNIINAITFGLVIIYILILSFYINGRYTLVSIQNDNEYNLGERNTFNNLFAFQRDVQLRFALNKRFARNTQHIIAFTFSSSSVTQNVNRNKEIYSMNTHLANFLHEIPAKLNLKKNNFVFAFY